MKIIIKSYKYFPSIRLNTNCKQEEKQGTGPGSCSGGKIGNQESDVKDTEYIGFKASHNFGFEKSTGSIIMSDPAETIKKDKDFTSKILPALNRAATPLRKFSNEDKQVIKEYARDAYLDINEYLGGKSEFSKTDIKRIENQILKLDKLFEDADLTDNLTVFRGIKEDILIKNPDILEALDNPQSIIQFKSYSSSSVLPFQAAGFAGGSNGRLVKLKLPRGSKALSISEESGIPNEFEILVNRGTKFKVGESKTEKIIPVNGRAFNMKVTTLEALI